MDGDISQWLPRAAPRQPISSASPPSTDQTQSGAGLVSHGRYRYSAITCRPDFSWPGGRRLAVYLGLNLEHFSFGERSGAELCPGGSHPDVLNYSWRDYGDRVGVWRLIDLFDELSLPGPVLVNSSIYGYCPEVMDVFRARGDEVVGHGRTNSERQAVLAPDDERRPIEEATAIIARDDIWITTAGGIAEFSASLPDGLLPV